MLFALLAGLLSAFLTLLLFALLAGLLSAFLSLLLLALLTGLLSAFLSLLLLALLAGLLSAFLTLLLLALLLIFLVLLFGFGHHFVQLGHAFGVIFRRAFAPTHVIASLRITALSPLLFALLHAAFLLTCIAAISVFTRLGLVSVFAGL